MLSQSSIIELKLGLKSQRVPLTQKIPPFQLVRRRYLRSGPCLLIFLPWANSYSPLPTCTMLDGSWRCMGSDYWTPMKAATLSDGRSVARSGLQRHKFCHGIKSGLGLILISFKMLWSWQILKIYRPFPENVEDCSSFSSSVFHLPTARGPQSEEIARTSRGNTTSNRPSPTNIPYVPSNEKTWPHKGTEDGDGNGRAEKPPHEIANN